MKSLVKSIEKQKRYVSIRTRVLFTVVFGLVILYALIYVISTKVLSNSYLEIEREEVIQDIDRAYGAVNDEMYLQYKNLIDWSPWDEMHLYTQDYALFGTKNREFEESTMFANGYIRQDQNAYFVTDNNGDIYYAVYVDLETKTELSSSTVVSFFEPKPELTIRTSEIDFKYGLVAMPEGPALFASKPSLTNDETGPVYASLALLRYLDTTKIEAISDGLDLKTEIFPVSGSDVPADVLKARTVLLSGEEYVVTAASVDTIYGYKLLHDVYDEPILVLKIETQRPIFAQGQKTISFFLIGGFLALVVYAFFITGLLERFVISRFVKLTRDVEKINTEKDISIQVQTGVDDDIGRLATKINQMLQWLSASQVAEGVSKQQTVKLLRLVEKGKIGAEKMVIERTQELNNEKARLLASINSLSFGFIVTDKNGNIIIHNPALLSILSLSKKPATVDDVSHIIQKKSQVGDFKLTSLITAAKASGKLTETKQVPYDLQFLRLVCTPIFPEQSVAKKSSTSAIIGYVVVIDDITDSINTERSRDEFFSIASHELRTPLTAIRWNTFMLLSDKAQAIKLPQREKLLTDIHSASVRLVSIVNDFLEVSRLEQKKILVEKKEFDIEKVIIDSVQNLQEVAAQKGLTLKADISVATTPSVIGDENRTKQVIDNLIGNAIKYTVNGSITLSIEVNKTHVKVLVKDTGIGISEQNQVRLFKKFQQANEDMLARQNSQSTGLGLYISLLIVNAMGGEICLEKSQLNMGSVFSFTLPKVRE